jgi:ABC-type sugar transport system substrate-binding protein
VAFDPADPTAAAEISKKVQDAGIGLLLYESLPPGISAPFARFNDSELMRQAGAEAATYVRDVLGQTPKAVIFDLLAFEICHVLRMGAFVEGMKSAVPETQIVFWDEVPFDKNLALAKMEDQLQANPDFNIYTGCGSDMVLGGIAGLESGGRGKADNKAPKTEYIVTIDGTLAELEHLVDPSSSVVTTVTMTPKVNGAAFWSMLKDILTGVTAPDEPLVVDLPGLRRPARPDHAQGLRRGGRHLPGAVRADRGLPAPGVPQGLTLHPSDSRARGPGDVRGRGSSAQACREAGTWGPRSRRTSSSCATGSRPSSAGTSTRR